jgi:hypothetical protein
MTGVESNLFTALKGRSSSGMALEASCGSAESDLLDDGLVFFNEAPLPEPRDDREGTEQHPQAATRDKSRQFESSIFFRKAKNQSAKCRSKCCHQNEPYDGFWPTYSRGEPNALHCNQSINRPAGQPPERNTEKRPSDDAPYAKVHSLRHPFLLRGREHSVRKLDCFGGNIQGRYRGQEEISFGRPTKIVRQHGLLEHVWQGNTQTLKNDQPDRPEQRGT